MMMMIIIIILLIVIIIIIIILTIINPLFMVGVGDSFRLIDADHNYYLIHYNEYLKRINILT